MTSKFQKLKTLQQFYDFLYVLEDEILIGQYFVTHLTKQAAENLTLLGINHDINNLSSNLLINQKMIF